MGDRAFWVIACYLSLLSSTIETSRCATIEGTVHSHPDGKPVSICTIGILNSRLGAITNSEGHYAIRNVPPGTQILQCRALAFISRFDTVAVTDSNQVVVANMQLDIPLIESAHTTEQYHEKLAAENVKHPVLEISLGCLTSREGFVTINPSIKNTSDQTIKILRIVECINPIEALVEDSSGHRIRPNLARMDCVGEKIFPDHNDEITIAAGKTIDYPPVRVEFFDFRRLPPGDYHIALKYRFKKPDQLCCYNFDQDYRKRYEDNINTLTTVLRGEYISLNRLIFHNTH